VKRATRLVKRVDPRGDLSVGAERDIMHALFDFLFCRNTCDRNLLFGTFVKQHGLRISCLHAKSCIYWYIL
jgi:hypothetical protein